MGQRLWYALGPMLQAAALLLYADYAGTLDVSNRTEVRVRHTDGAAPDPSLDLVDTPIARLSVAAHQWEYTLGYSAVAVAPDVEAQVLPQLSQYGDVGASWHDRRVRIDVTEAASYGAQNPGLLLTLPAAATANAPTTPPGPTAPPATSLPPGAQALAAPATIFFGRSTTTLATRLTLSRRWFASTSLAYTLGGGLDAASRAALPFVGGPRAEALASYSLTRGDVLDSRAAAQHGTATASPCSAAISGVTAADTCSPLAESVQLTESWRRQLTRSTQAWLGGGASVVHVRLRPTDPNVDRVYPVALTGFLHEHEVNGIRTLIRFDAQVSPLLDARTGVLDERATGTLSVTLPFRRLALLTALAGTRSIASPFVRPVKVVQGTAEAEYRVSPLLTLGVGGRYAWQEQAGIGEFAGGLVFAQATFHAPQLKF